MKTNMQKSQIRIKTVGKVNKAQMLKRKTKIEKNKIRTEKSRTQ